MEKAWVLVLNAGSSSLKFSIFNPLTGECPFQGIAERLLSAEATFTCSDDNQTTTFEIPKASVDIAIQHVMDRMPADAKLCAIGHRVVHGGDKFQTAVMIDDQVLDVIKACTQLAPLHNPANISGIEAMRSLFPDLPQVAVFDTAFHSTLPEVAYRYAIPASLDTDFAIRRYGFHGTSHHFVALEAAKRLEKPFDQLQVISAHLGNGCSLCAIKNGCSVDTTMGMTPLEGLVMGTRSGDIDPGIIFWLAEHNNLSMDEISDLLNHKSGLLGLSGLSNDLRTLEQARSKGHPAASLAIDIFAYRLAKSIAAMSVTLDRIDGLLFTGGIGENSSLVRELVVSRLGLLGLALDKNKNTQTHPNRIEAENSAPILVIETHEEWMIARETFQQVEVCK